MGVVFFYFVCRLASLCTMNQPPSELYRVFNARNYFKLSINWKTVKDVGEDEEEIRNYAIGNVLTGRVCSWM
jgi:hypothetical protein